MTAKCFVDTNILVYAVDEGAGSKRDFARRILANEPGSPAKAISTQVLLEFYAAATRKLRLAPAEAREMTMLWRNFEVVVNDAEDVLQAVDACILGGLSVWDALILTAARKASCEVLWTEDLTHGQIIQGVRIENPFLGAGTVRETRARYSVRREARAKK